MKYDYDLAPVTEYVVIAAGDSLMIEGLTLLFG